MKPKAKPARKQTRLIDKKTAFLAAFVACASLTEAAAAVKMDRGQHYAWLRDDPLYVKAFELARQQAGDTLKDDAVHWARIGVYEPLVYQGQFCYKQRDRKLVTLENGEEIDEKAHKAMEKLLGQPVAIVSHRAVRESYGRPLGIFRRSEGLHARLLKAFLPAEFGDKLSAELTGKDGGALEISVVDRLNAARARLAKTKNAPKPD